MKVNIDVSGMDNAIKQLSIFEQKKTQQVTDVINESSIKIMNGAKQRCNVDTGRLRGSITMEPSEGGLKMNVGTKVDYAPYVEFGTGKFVDIPAAAGFSANGRATPWLYPESKGGVLTGEMIFTHGSKPNPFLFPAAEEEQPRYIAAMREALNR